ncbi:MAG: hypothetical protein QW154_07315 [Sulfolobales archaeon]
MSPASEDRNLSIVSGSDEQHIDVLRLHYGSIAEDLSQHHCQAILPEAMYDGPAGGRDKGARQRACLEFAETS